MLDPLLTLLAAKAKAVGLVAGTALATSALVGGGAVAMTAVSHESDAQPAVEQVVDADGEASTTEADAVSESDSGTVDMELPPLPTEPVEQDVTTDLDRDGLADATGLPVGFVCDDSKNHGQNVSSFAKSHKGPGHGKLVSAIAKSDCGKGAEDAAETETAEEEQVEAESVEAESTEEQAEAPKPVKPAKAQKPAKAEKPSKAEKPAKAQKPAKAEKPAKQGGKGGQGGGKG